VFELVVELTGIFFAGDRDRRFIIDALLSRWRGR